jgi:PAS domain-containing protein
VPLLGLLLAAVIFTLDYEAPVGAAVGMLYVGVILLGLWTPSMAYPVVAAGGASLLVAFDLYASWSADVPPGVMINHPLMILVFGITAIVVRRFVLLERQAEAHFEQLGDFKRALDASAIVAITDVKGRITYVNDKFTEISGYSREDLIG